MTATPKKLAALALLATALILMSPSASAQYPEPSLSSLPENANISHYWRMGVLTDSVGSTNLTVGGGSPSAVQGLFGNAYDFEATNSDYLQASTSFSPTQGTISIWTNVESLGQAVGDKNFYISSRNGGADPEYINFYSQEGNLLFQIETGGDRKQVSNLSTIQVGNWYHLVASWGPNGMRLYVNKTLVDSNNLTRSWNENSPYNFGLQPGFNEYLDGKMDEVAFYDKQLSDAQVAQLYEAYIPPDTTNLVTSGYGSISASGQSSNGSTASIETTDARGAGGTGSAADGSSITFGVYQLATQANPTVDEARFYPAAPKPSESIQVIYETTDTDNVVVQWYVNSSPVSNQDLLESGNYSEGDTLTAQITPYNGATAGNSTNITTTVLPENITASTIQGNGSQSNPWKIHNFEELRIVAYNQSFGGYLELQGDISGAVTKLSSNDDVSWTVVLNSTLDGGGHGLYGFRDTCKDCATLETNRAWLFRKNITNVSFVDNSVTSRGARLFQMLGSTVTNTSFINPEVFTALGCSGGTRTDVMLGNADLKETHFEGVYSECTNDGLENGFLFSLSFQDDFTGEVTDTYVNFDLAPYWGAANTLAGAQINRTVFTGDLRFPLTENVQGASTSVTNTYCENTSSGACNSTLSNDGTYEVQEYNASVLKQQSTYAGFDFTNTWGITEGNYPYLRNAPKTNSQNTTPLVEASLYVQSEGKLSFQTRLSGDKRIRAYCYVNNDDRTNTTLEYDVTLNGASVSSGTTTDVSPDTMSLVQDFTAGTLQRDDEVVVSCTATGTSGKSLTHKRSYTIQNHVPELQNLRASDNASDVFASYSFYDVDNDADQTIFNWTKYRVTGTGVSSEANIVDGDPDTARTYTSSETTYWNFTDVNPHRDTVMLISVQQATTYNNNPRVAIYNYDTASWEYYREGSGWSTSTQSLYAGALDEGDYRTIEVPITDYVKEGQPVQFRLQVTSFSTTTWRLWDSVVVLNETKRNAGTSSSISKSTIDPQEALVFTATANDGLETNEENDGTLYAQTNEVPSMVSAQINNGAASGHWRNTSLDLSARADDDNNDSVQYDYNLTIDGTQSEAWTDWASDGRASANTGSCSPEGQDGKWGDFVHYQGQTDAITYNTCTGVWYAFNEEYSASPDFLTTTGLPSNFTDDRFGLVYIDAAPVIMYQRNASRVEAYEFNGSSWNYLPGYENINQSLTEYQKTDFFQDEGRLVMLDWQANVYQSYIHDGTTWNRNDTYGQNLVVSYGYDDTEYADTMTIGGELYFLIWGRRSSNPATSDVRMFKWNETTWVQDDNLVRSGWICTEGSCPDLVDPVNGQFFIGHVRETGDLRFQEMNEDGTLHSRFLVSGFGQGSSNSFKTVAAPLQAGSTYQFDVQAKDHYSTSSNLTSNSFLVTNTPPVAQNLTLTPVNTTDVDNVTGNYTYFDEDGDPENGTSIYWYVNDNIVATNQSTLSSSNYAANDELVFQVIPHDGAQSGNQANITRTIIQSRDAPTAGVRELRDSQDNKVSNFVDLDVLTDYRWYASNFTHDNITDPQARLSLNIFTGNQTLSILNETYNATNESFIYSSFFELPDYEQYNYEFTITDETNLSTTYGGLVQAINEQPVHLDTGTFRFGQPNSCQDGSSCDLRVDLQEDGCSLEPQFEQMIVYDPNGTVVINDTDLLLVSESNNECRFKSDSFTVAKIGTYTYEYTFSDYEGLNASDSGTFGTTTATQAPPPPAAGPGGAPPAEIVIIKEQINVSFELVPTDATVEIAQGSRYLGDFQVVNNGLLSIPVSIEANRAESDEEVVDWINFDGITRIENLTIAAGQGLNSNSKYINYELDADANTPPGEYLLVLDVQSGDVLKRHLITVQVEESLFADFIEFLTNPLFELGQECTTPGVTSNSTQDEIDAATVCEPMFVVTNGVAGGIVLAIMGGAFFFTRRRDEDDVRGGNR